MPNPSRRTVLTGAAAVAAAAGGGALGLTRHVNHKIATRPPAAPSALIDAVSGLRRLITACDQAVRAAVAGTTELGLLRADLSTQQAALLAVLDRYPGWRLAQVAPTPTSTTSPGGDDVPLAGTAAAIRTAIGVQVGRLATACAGWPAGEAQAGTVVPLLGSIAAGLGVHADRLR